MRLRAIDSFQSNLVNNLFLGEIVLAERVTAERTKKNPAIILRICYWGMQNGAKVIIASGCCIDVRDNPRWDNQVSPLAHLIISRSPPRLSNTTLRWLLYYCSLAYLYFPELPLGNGWGNRASYLFILSWWSLTNSLQIFELTTKRFYILFFRILHASMTSTASKHWVQVHLEG